MAITYLKGLQQHPHPTPEDNKALNNKYQRQLKDRRPTTHDTDPNGEGTGEEEQAEEAGIGGGEGIGGSSLQRSRGHRLPYGQAHSTTRLETVL